MISLDRYGALLARPELRAAVLSSVLGRLPIGITGLSILLLAQSSASSFAVGGAMTAAYLLGLATVAPLLGRIIDRTGPRRVLAASAVTFPSSLCALVLAMHLAEIPALHAALAFAAGATFPPITVCMRTFFRQQLSDESQRATAYSLESVLIELIFIVGPMLVAVMVAFASPAAAVLLAALSAAIGTTMFVRSRALTHWRIEKPALSHLLGPLSERGFATLLFAVTGYASAFGLVEIGVTAYAAAQGRPALAGILLALMSVGSALGGLAYGGRSWSLPLKRQFSIALALMAIGMALLVPTQPRWLFALLCFVAGIVMAPALTMQSMLVAKIASPRHAAEAFTWSSTALLVGVGVGMALGGWLIERWGWSATFLAASLGALCSSGLAFLLRVPR